MSRRWNVQTLEAARRAVWSEGDADWDARAELCLGHVMQGRRLAAGDRVLDLGCGIGRLTIPLAARHPRCDFVGYDTSPEMLSWARQIVPHPNVTWQLGGPLPHVEVAYSVVTIQHLDPDTVRTYLRELGRVVSFHGWLRFQFVEGDYHYSADHRYTTGWMIDELRESHLRVVEVDRHVMYEEWTWITAERDGT